MVERDLEKMKPISERNEKDKQKEEIKEFSKETVDFAKDIFSKDKRYEVLKECYKQTKQIAKKIKEDREFRERVETSEAKRSMTPKF